MNVEQIFAKVGAHMATGLLFHNQVANAYSFLNLCGYQHIHCDQLIDETKNYRGLQDFYTNQYHKLLPLEPSNYDSIIPSSWYKYAREDVDSNTKRAATRDLMERWVKWELETKKLLQQSYKQLCDLEEICAAKYIYSLLKDVDKELQEAQNLYINLNSVDYDMVHIIETQQ